MPPKINQNYKNKEKLIKQILKLLLFKLREASLYKIEKRKKNPAG